MGYIGIWEEFAVPVYVEPPVSCVVIGFFRQVTVKYDTISGKI